MTMNTGIYIYIYVYVYVDYPRLQTSDSSMCKHKENTYEHTFSIDTYIIIYSFIV